MSTNTIAKAPAANAAPKPKAPAANAPKAPKVGGIRSDATKYRVEIRKIAKREGWTFKQTSAYIDRFTRKGEVIDVTHGYSDLITHAEYATSKGIDKAAALGKMYQVQAWLTGIADPGRKNKIRLSPEQVTANESGVGIANIDRELGIENAAPVKPSGSASGSDRTKAVKPRQEPVKGDRKPEPVKEDQVTAA